MHPLSKTTKTSGFAALLSLTLILALCAGISAQTPGGASASKNLPADKAGTIPEPTGLIAFIRGGDVYIMNSDGTNVTLACDANNATGRLSWSPDNKWIAFTRRGEVQVNNPDGLGGQHRLYDIFKVEIDSVGLNSAWWRRITDGNGSRYPEWSVDGETIIYTHDLNANYIDAEFPSYQTVTCDPDGGSRSYKRKDYQQTEYMAINPTAGPNGAYAFVAFYEKKPQGLYVAQPGVPLPNLADMKKAIRAGFNRIAPSWSPDGNWIAYVYNDLANPAIWITNPEQSEKYLIYQPPAGVAPNTVPPSWSPDSKWLTFSTDDGRIWIADITGNQLTEVLGPGPNIAPGWSK